MWGRRWAPAGGYRNQADETTQTEFVIYDGAIEGGLHQRRDVSLAEDRGQVRTGNAAQVLASLNNAVIGLAALVGEANLAEAQRGFAYRFDKAMHDHNATRQVEGETKAEDCSRAAPVRLLQRSLAPAA